MKFENIDVKEAIDQAKNALVNDKAISAKTKAIFELLLVIIAILVNKLNLNSSNSSKPPSSDLNRMKKRRFKQYDFILLSDMDGKSLEPNKLYLEASKEKIIYQCLGKNNIITQGTISPAELPKNIQIPKKNNLADFLKIRKEILKITANRGDTEPLRNPGGQFGRKGKTLSPVENPDEIKQILIDKRQLPKGQQYTAKGYTARQIVNINISRHIIEYRAEILIDSLGNEYEAEFPQNITRPIQYGTSVKVRSTFASVYQLIPYSRLQEQFKNEYNIPLSIGSIYNFNKEVANKLVKLGFDLVVKKELINSYVVHADETGINGKKIWLHNFSNEEWTWLEPHTIRGTKAMDDIGLLTKFRGRLCHDHWKSYFTYSCVHSLCNAHHLRELTWSFEQDNQKWAKKMHIFLVNLNQEIDNTDKNCLSKKEKSDRIDEYRAIIAEGEIESPAVEAELGKKRKPKQSKSRNLLVRLRDYEDAVLLFMKDSLVPFTNNQGERDLRMIKVHQKISGCFKTLETARQFCKIRSYLSTCKKNGVSATDALELLFEDKLPKFIQEKIDSS